MSICQTDQSARSIRVLLIDDDEDDILLIRHMLRARVGIDFEVDLATNYEAGLRICERNEHDICLIDYHLDVGTGVELYLESITHGFDGPMIILTGQGNHSVDMEAMLAGATYLLDKNRLDPIILERTIRYAVEQYRALQMERADAEQKLKGGVDTLIRVLKELHPAAYERGERVRELATALATRTGISSPWWVAASASLSQLGCVGMPAGFVESVYRSDSLRIQERATVEQLPALAETLIAGMPGIDPVREILVHVHRRFEEEEGPGSTAPGEEIPFGARLLKLALDFAALEAEGLAVGLALDTMRGRCGWYDPALFQTLVEIQGGVSPGPPVRELPPGELRQGMTLAQDLRSPSGSVVATEGVQLTPGMLVQIRMARCVGANETVRVFLSATDVEASDVIGGKVIRVLHIDDEEDANLMVRDMLSEVEGESFQLDWESTVEEGLAQVQLGKHDVYLVDYSLGSGNGLDLMREARRQGCQVPMILLTGQGDRDLDVQAMETGAADFLDKNRLDASILERSIRYAIRESSRSCPTKS